ncbi:MAG: dihydrolipoyl dehydrogenase [Chloroflexi bacterium RBG_16_68_14]|nr:MAG: dihydrolipoyl dehydrogenase [Chloroflexi bacterium RBG_16_68_14]
MAKYDVAILGGGPGGYVAAIRAAQLGLKPALIEQDRVGGLCLNWGCIPSKALLWNAELVRLFRESEEFGITYDALHIDMGKAIDRSRQVVDRMVKGVEFLLKKNKVASVAGRGRLKSRTEVAVEPSGDVIEAEHIIIATGARSRSLPGVEIDGRTVITSREALELREAPESVVIVGGGPVGAEFAYFYRAYGSQVTLIEMLDHLLPLEDGEISRQLERAFKQQGIAYRTKAKVAGVTTSNGRAMVAVSTEGGEEEFAADKVLIGVGMAANTDGLGLEELGVALERGFVRIDERMRTSVPQIFAIGDVTGKLMLAHVASAQGVAAVEEIAGREPLPLAYEKMPRCTYCQPQVASLGLTEAQARERGLEVKVGTFPYRGNGKAVAMGRTEGLVKLVADARTGEIVGYHMIGQDATELLAEASLGSVLEATPRELGWAVHAHPTLSEIVKEAALAVEGEAIHFWTE